MKEKIESYDTIILKQKNHENIREHVVREHHTEARKTWTQIKDKWDKLK